MSREFAIFETRGGGYRQLGLSDMDDGDNLWAMELWRVVGTVRVGADTPVEWEILRTQKALQLFPMHWPWCVDANNKSFQKKHAIYSFRQWIF